MTWHYERRGHVHDWSNGPYVIRWYEASVTQPAFNVWRGNLYYTPADYPLFVAQHIAWITEHWIPWWRVMRDV